MPYTVANPGCTTWTTVTPGFHTDPTRGVQPQGKARRLKRRATAPRVMAAGVATGPVLTFGLERPTDSPLNEPVRQCGGVAVLESQAARVLGSRLHPEDKVFLARWDLPAQLRGAVDHALVPFVCEPPADGGRDGAALPSGSAVLTALRAKAFVNTAKPPLDHGATTPRFTGHQTAGQHEDQLHTNRLRQYMFALPSSDMSVCDTGADLEFPPLFHGGRRGDASPGVCRACGLRKGRGQRAAPAPHREDFGALQVDTDSAVRHGWPPRPPAAAHARQQSADAAPGRAAWEAGVMDGDSPMGLVERRHAEQCGCGAEVAAWVSQGGIWYQGAAKPLVRKPSSAGMPAAGTPASSVMCDAATPSTDTGNGATAGAVRASASSSWLPMLAQENATGVAGAREPAIDWEGILGPLRRVQPSEGSGASRPPSECDPASAAAHSALREFVLHEHVYYVVLHARRGGLPCGMVVLFAVGVSPHSGCLIGAVSSQACDGLCD